MWITRASTNILFTRSNHTDDHTVIDCPFCATSPRTSLLGASFAAYYRLDSKHWTIDSCWHGVLGMLTPYIWPHSAKESANSFIDTLLHLQLGARGSIRHSASRRRSALPILPPFRSC